jgi:DNA-binding CsgD family transcriptional regulator
MLHACERQSIQRSPDPRFGRVFSTAEWLALLGAVLDLRPFPIVLLKPNLTVGFMTPATRSALLEDGITQSPQGGLRLNEPSADESLAKALKGMACEDGMEPAPRILAFELAHGASRVLKIEALRLPEGYPVKPCDAGTWFELSIRKTLRGPKILPAQIAAVLDLTAAEANLASALAEGLTLQGYAERELLKVTTVRWHLQNVFNRTGTRSQSDLVSMLVSLFG